MKKKFQIAIFIVCFYLIFMIGRGVYYYIIYNGRNVSLTLSTQFSPQPSSISLCIDDNLYYENDSLQTMYEFINIELSLGFHRLRLNIDGETFEDFFIVLPVRWIYIEIQKYNSTNYKENEDWVHIYFTNTPTELM